jgi:hypothetical protein
VQGGRFNDVILREDQLLAKMHRLRKKKSAQEELDPFAPEYTDETWHQVSMHAGVHLLWVQCFGCMSLGQVFHVFYVFNVEGRPGSAGMGLAFVVRLAMRHGEECQTLCLAISSLPSDGQPGVVVQFMWCSWDAWQSLCALQLVKQRLKAASVGSWLQAAALPGGAGAKGAAALLAGWKHNPNERKHVATNRRRK